MSAGAEEAAAPESAEQAAEDREKEFDEDDDGFDNPMAAARANGGDVEVALANLKQNHARQTAEVQAQGLKIKEMERMLRSQAGSPEANPAETDDEESGLLVYASKAARHVYAERTSTPACFHQVTTVMLLDKARVGQGSFHPHANLSLCQSL